MNYGTKNPVGCSAFRAARSSQCALGPLAAAVDTCTSPRIAHATRVPSSTATLRSPRFRSIPGPGGGSGKGRKRHPNRTPSVHQWPSVPFHRRSSSEATKF